MTNSSRSEDASGRALRGASRRSQVAGFMVMDVMQAAAAMEAQGRSIIHMEVGQPGTPAPALARRAVEKALDHDALGYTLALGLDPLRERIARHYRETYGISVARDRIIVTPGSSGAFSLAFLALFDVGSRVALPSPGYPCYRHILSALDTEHVLIETGPDTRWMPRVEDLIALDEARRLDGILIASPANPTGTCLTPERLEALTRVCRERSIWFISDEIYHGLTYEGPAATALEYSDEAIIINSFSKYYSMTGWRVGWMIVPDRLVRTVERLAQNLFISAPAASQVAALAAFEATDELERNKATYARNRARLLEVLPKAGFTNLAPADGAFYIYADVSNLTSSSASFARDMLEDIGVATTPGLDFDEDRGARYLRFSYAGTEESMEEACRRLLSWSRLASAPKPSGTR